MPRTPARQGKDQPPPAREGEGQPPGPPIVREIPVTPHFNQVFYTTAGLTASCLIISLVLALQGRETQTSREVISGCLTMANIGFGAIVGLIGGKAI